MTQPPRSGSDNLTSGERNLLAAAASGKHITHAEVEYLTRTIQKLRRACVHEWVENPVSSVKRRSHVCQRCGKHGRP